MVITLFSISDYLKVKLFLVLRDLFVVFRIFFTRLMTNLSFVSNIVTSDVRRSILRLNLSKK